MIHKEEAEKKLNTESIALGYDLGDYYTQISYCHFDEEEPTTFSTVIGGEAYNIPTCLAKRQDVNQWTYGREAETLGNTEGTLLTHLVTKAYAGEQITIGEYNFDSEDLLALFIKRSLSVLGTVSMVGNVSAICFTVDRLDQRMIAVLEHCIENAGFFEQVKIYFQTREESFFSYIIKQPKELWETQVVMFDASMGHLRAMRMEMNRKTTPVVTFIDTHVYPEISLAHLPKSKTTKENFLERMDGAICTVAEGLCDNKRVQSAYLIGEIFTEQWTNQTLQFLCRGRRVFQGTNLFSKGACYNAMERQNETEVGKQHVFLGNDKLKTNVGMQIIRDGKPSYFAVLNAGSNWFETKKTYDIILEEGRELQFILTPLTGKEKKEAKLILDGYPYKERKVTRMQIVVDMTSETILRVQVEDLGFGELFPSTGLSWKEEIKVE